MKVKDLIEKLHECNPEKDVTYECMHIDYLVDTEDHVDLVGLHLGYYGETDEEALKHYKP